MTPACVESSKYEFLGASLDTVYQIVINTFWRSNLVEESFITQLRRSYSTGSYASNATSIVSDWGRKVLLQGNT